MSLGGVNDGGEQNDEDWWAGRGGYWRTDGAMGEGEMEVTDW